MSQPEYGSIDYYKDQFRELLADVVAEDPKYGDSLVAGFVQAIKEWRQYHIEQANEYEKLGERIRLSLSV